MTLTRRQFNSRLAALAALPSARSREIRLTFAPHSSPDRDIGIRFGLEDASRAASLLGRTVVQGDGGNITISGGVLKAGDLYFTTRNHDCDLIDDAMRIVKDPTKVDVFEWHHSLRKFGAAELNARFTRATGLKMTAAHWCAWMAVKIAVEASLRAAGPGDLPTAIARGKYDGHKGVPLTFATTTTSQFAAPLQQPLYVVYSVTDRIAWPRQ